MNNIFICNIVIVVFAYDNFFEDLEHKKVTAIALQSGFTITTYMKLLRHDTTSNGMLLMDDVLERRRSDLCG